MTEKEFNYNTDQLVMMHKKDREQKELEKKRKNRLRRLTEKERKKFVTRLVITSSIVSVTLGFFLVKKPVADITFDETLKEAKLVENEKLDDIVDDIVTFTEYFELKREFDTILSKFTLPKSTKEEYENKQYNGVLPIFDFTQATIKIFEPSKMSVEEQEKIYEDYCQIKQYIDNQTEYILENFGKYLVKASVAETLNVSEADIIIPQEAYRDYNIADESVVYYESDYGKEVYTIGENLTSVVDMVYEIQNKGDLSESEIIGYLNNFEDVLGYNYSLEDNTIVETKQNTKSN